MAKQTTAPQKKTSGGAKEKWYDLGTVRTPKGKTPYIVLDKNVEILVGGKSVDLGDYRTLRFLDPYASLDALLEGEHISEDDHATRKEALEQRNVKYKVTAPPAGKAEDNE